MSVRQNVPQLILAVGGTAPVTSVARDTIVCGIVMVDPRQ
jgi:hypothetical protein